MKCPQCQTVMRSNYYQVRSGNKYQISGEVYWFKCPKCGHIERFFFCKCADLFFLQDTYGQRFDEFRQEIRELNHRIEILNMGGGEAIKKLETMRQALMKLLRHLF
jgi:hypothetical protein